jgi:outer membrane receptor protein involved in Fe transport
VRVQIGARFDYWDLQGDKNSPAAERNATSFPAFSPRLAVITKPTKSDIVKLLFGSAFRAPSAYEFFYNDGGVTQVVSTKCGSELSPEHVYSAEVEGTHRFDHDWVGLASVHGTLAQNIIETVPVGDVCANGDGTEEAIYYKNSEVDQRIVGGDLELRREFRAGIMASLQYGILYARYAERPDESLGLPSDRRLPNAPTNYAGVKLIFPIVQNAVTGAFRAGLEDRRRLDPAVTERSERAVVADAVLSGFISRHGLRYAAGVYNIFNWQYALPAVPYASPVMPQNGRSFIFSLTLYK